MIVIVLLVLVVFGPLKAAGVARDLGRFAGEARGQVEELKDELATTSSGEDREEDRRRREPRARGRVGGAPAGGTGSERGGAPGREGMRRAGPAREEAPDRAFARKPIDGLLERDVKAGLPAIELLDRNKHAPIRPTKSTLLTIPDLHFPRPTNYRYGGLQ